MANSYLVNLRLMAIRLWLPIDDDPANPLDRVPGGMDGIFEAAGNATGTWVAVSGVPDPQVYVAVELLPASQGIREISSPLSILDDGSVVFGLTLAPGAPASRVLAVRLVGPAVPPLVFERSFRTFAIDVEPLPPVPKRGACGGEFQATLTDLPAIVFRELALRPPAEVFGMEPGHNVALVGFAPTGPASGRLAFRVTAASDLQTLALVAAHPSDGRRVVPPAITRFHQAVPRAVLAGVWSGAAFPAVAPARFRIGPIPGMAPGDAEVVHALHANLSLSPEPIEGTYFFQVRAARADVAPQVPAFDPEIGLFETRETEGLGVVIRAEAEHARLVFGEVRAGAVGPMTPLAGTNRIAFASGLPAVTTIDRAGVRETAHLPDHALVFAYDQVELTHPDTGLLRELDASRTNEGTNVRITVFLANECGVVTPVELA